MRGRLSINPYGALSIWEHPEPGAAYCIGVDTSSGIRESVKEGDPSAACVIEMRTCRLVALMHGYQDPTMWGWACCRLAWLYNTAWLAIETQPSQHGLTAYLAAERYGYERLFRQRRSESIKGRFVERRGWVRPAGSLGELWNRVRTALREECAIPSALLLDELAALRYEEGKFVSDEHDDAAVAYGIALLARDQLYADGEVVEAAPKALDLADRFWKAQSDSDREPARQHAGDDYHDTWPGL